MYGGVSKEYQIPVCRCGDMNCSLRFIRILPDIMTPHKHYSTEVIENVVDEVCTPETLQTEDYPCELTMTRWKAWIAGNVNHVNGVLKSIGSRLFEFGTELLNSKTSLVDQLREDGEGWLTVMNRITWNSGMPFFNARQLSSVSTDLFSVSDKDVLTFLCKERNIHEKQRSNRLAGKYSPEQVSDHSAASGSDP